MIARLWRGHAADTAKADAYVRHFTGTVTTELEGLSGTIDHPFAVRSISTTV